MQLMTDFLYACLKFDPLAIVQAGGYLAIAIFIFAESGLLIGIFLPGDSLLFAAGLVAGTGYLSYPVLVVIAVLAAIFGDTTGYWFGKNVGVNFFTREESFFFKRSYVDRTRAFYEKYGGRAIVLARFVPIVRTVAPIMAGIGKMRYGRFVSYNALGGFLWAFGMTSLGYFLGAIIPNSEHYILPLSLVIVALSFLPLAWNLLRGRKTL